MPELIQVIINSAMQTERQQYLKAEPYQHTEKRQGHANGYAADGMRWLPEILYNGEQLKKAFFYSSDNWEKLTDPVVFDVTLI